MRKAEGLHRLRQRMSRRAVLSGLGHVLLSGILCACRGLRTPAGPTTTGSSQLPATSGLPMPTPTDRPTIRPASSATSTPATRPAHVPPLIATRQTEAFLPMVSSAGDGQGREATAVPSASSTATKAPTQTPWPTATPFPPGPPTKLGLYVTHHHPQVLDLVRTGNVAVIKTISRDSDFLAEVKHLSPSTLIVGRILLDQVELASLQPTEGARRLVNQLLPIAGDPGLRGVVDAWEGHNEPVATDSEQMKRFAELEAERVRLLAGEGIRSVVGNFGTGHPVLELWPQFFPALEAALQHDGLLGLHEYSAPTMQYGTHDDGEGWLTLRYRKAYRQYLIPAGLQVPLVMTECGVDGLVGDRPGPEGKGWKDFPNYWASQGMGIDGTGNYIEQLAWYDSELMKDSYVVGAAIFTMTTTREWRSYEILGDAATILQQYLSVHPLR